MKNVGTGAIAALLASTAIATAGGIDRSGQSVGILFEEGTYAELSYGYVDPTVSGTSPVGPFPGSGSLTGDMAPAYSLMAGGFKFDLTDSISAAVIFDQPFGANADYSQGFYTGTGANLSSSAVTALVSYDVNDNITVYGGAALQTMSATASVFNPFFQYAVEAGADSGVGYVAGAAYQRPDIALRVALTYRSAISTDHDTWEGFPDPLVAQSTTSIATPQSLNLEFQTGLNQKTLVFGSVRWVEWSEFSLDPLLYPPVTPLSSYENDVITYSLGIGRKLTDNLSGALTVGYEAALGGTPSALAPTDGYLSLGAGLTYSFDNIEISGGVKYLWLGDAADPGVGTFSGNNAMAFGLKIAYAL